MMTVGPHKLETKDVYLYILLIIIMNIILSFTRFYYHNYVDSSSFFF